jgi:hypothetical protein
MTNLNRDPIINVIYNGIKKYIRVALQNECYRAAVILTYSGIDTMAFLNMPSQQVDVTKDDFVEWAEKYIHFPGKEQLTGLDMYGARCGALHNYGTSSRLYREGQCRQIGYTTGRNIPAISYAPHISKSLVLVSIEALAEAFFNGVNKFLIDLFADTTTATAKAAESRLQHIFHVIPVEDKTRDGNAV